MYSTDESDQSIYLAELNSSMSRRNLSRGPDLQQDELSNAFSRVSGSTNNLERSLLSEQRRNNALKQSSSSNGRQSQFAPRRRAPNRPSSVNNSRSNRENADAAPLTSSENLFATRYYNVIPHIFNGIVYHSLCIHLPV